MNSRMVDVSGVRSALQGLDKATQSNFIALRNCLDPALMGVPHLSHQSEFFGHVDGKVSVSDTLNASCHVDGNSLFYLHYTSSFGRASCSNDDLLLNGDFLHLVANLKPVCNAQAFDHLAKDGIVTVQEMNWIDTDIKL